MPSYRALIEGRNFLVSVDGRTRRHGFYQTVFVQGVDPTDAEANAIQIVKDDAQLKQMTQNAQSDPPMLVLDSLYEAEVSELPPVATGRTYFVEKHWWQFWR
jgi:hypothetical protein